MAAVTFTTPRGSVIRTARSTRFVVVKEAVESGTGLLLENGRIVKGSASLATARSAASKNVTFPGGFTAHVVIDLSTGNPA